MKPAPFNDAHLELHVFSDASQTAYGCVIYLRCVGKDGYIHVSLVCSKNKLAPIKTISIPRLEWQASYMAATMEYTVRNESMGITLGPSTLWCDSTIVLAYVKNTSTRYHVYVANMVSGILEHSTPEQWNHIPGKRNPADLLTRGITDSQLSDVWMYRPEFLKSRRSEWKFDAQQSYDVPLGDPEVKRSLYSYDCNVNPLHPVDCMINFYSDWEILLRGVVWLLKIHAKLLKREVSMVLLSSDMEVAENLIIRHVQMRCYLKERIRLLIHESVPYNSKLKKLSPRVNDDEIIVVSERLKHANTSDRSKEPYIVPHL